MRRRRFSRAFLLALPACSTKPSTPKLPPIEAVDVAQGPTSATAPSRVVPPYHQRPPRTPEENAAVLARVESFYAAAAPFECELDSEVVGVPPIGVPSRARIHLTFERPGRFHMELTGGTVVVANAGVLTIADPTAPGVVQTTVADDYVPVPIAWAGHFTNQIDATTAPQSFGAIVFSHDALGARLAAAYWVDASGEVTRTQVVGGKDLYQVIKRVSCNMHIKPPPAMFVVSPWRVFKSGASPLLGMP